MDTKDQGYESTRFENDVDENYLCPICMNVLKDPVQCTQNEHYFCTPCIRRHLQKNSNTCPSCRDELTLETLGKPSRIMTGYLSNLKIRCDYFNRGCREVLHLEDLETHVTICGFSAVNCSNEGCLIEINQRDRIYHETEVCEFRKVKKCHDCAAMKKDFAEMRKEIKDVKMYMKELRDQLSHMRSSQQEIMKNVEDLIEIKDQLKILKELKDTVEKMMEPTNNSEVNQFPEVPGYPMPPLRPPEGFPWHMPPRGRGCRRPPWHRGRYM